MTDLTTRTSMSLPPGLLEAFDRVSHQSGYADRSKALQAAMRAFISDSNRESRKETLSGRSSWSTIMRQKALTRQSRKRLIITDNQYSPHSTPTSTTHTVYAPCWSEGRCQTLQAWKAS